MALNSKHSSGRISRLSSKNWTYLTSGFHDLCHTHASILLELGEELKVIQEQLGHATLSITADTYTHVSETLRTRPAELLSNAFFGTQN